MKNYKIAIVIICIIFLFCGCTNTKTKEKNKVNKTEITQNEQNTENNNKQQKKNLSDEEESVVDISLSKEEQADIMSKKVKKWVKNRLDTEWFPYRYLALTDLDFDGKIELIISTGMQGSGLFTISNFYQVNAEGTSLQECEGYVEDRDEEDIVDAIDTAYYNQKTNRYNYITRSYARNGYMEYGDTVHALSFDKGKIMIDSIAYFYHNEEPSYGEVGDTYIKFVDGKEKKITKKEYKPNELAEAYFKDCKKMSVTIKWIKLNKKWKKYSENEIAKKLLKSYNVFSVKNAK